MVAFTKSLPLKIGAIILVIETIVLSALGVYYVDRFSREIDQRIAGKVSIPGTLMSHEALNYDIVRDREAMRNLVEQRIVEAYVIRRDGYVFYASRPDAEDTRYEDAFQTRTMPKLDTALTEPVIDQHKSEGKTLLSIFTPIRRENRLVGYLYLLTDVSGAQDEKRAIAWLFFVSSLICIVLTTLVEFALVHLLTVPRINRTIRCLCRVEEGDYSASLRAADDGDELNLLQRHVNTMVDGIRRNDADKQKALDALQVSERRFRQLTQLLPQTVFECDRDARITYINDAGLAMFGHSRDDVARGVSVWDVLSVDDNPTAPANFAKALEGALSQANEYRVRRKDGTLFPVMVYSSRVVAHDEIAGLRGIVVDLTELKRREEENMDLHERLRHVEKMQAIGQLAGGIAHDINNQLTGIVGCTSMLDMSITKTPETAEYLEIVKTAARNATRLVSQLLTFARKGPHAAREVDLHSCTENVVGLLAHSIDKKVVVRSRLDAAEATVWGDTAQVENALLNLGLNARDAMPDGGTLEFATSLEQVDSRRELPFGFVLEPGAYVCVRVSDTGKGMSAGVRERIFEPFFTTKPEGEGTGMGLATVYGAVKQHGGAVTVESEAGNGTVFSVYFPRHQTAKPRTRRDTEPQPPEATGGLRILVVDDEEVARKATVAMLRGLHHTVVEVDNGEDAIACYRDNRSELDLVLLDMVMPRMSGTEVFVALAQMDPEVRVIIMSGYASESRVQCLLDEGIQGFLAKPVSLEALRAALGSVRR
ncbi:MAG: response regulator [Chitinivibrionales bacterium]|nr:response regulator [Chitinivibrionales bacterium]